MSRWVRDGHTARVVLDFDELLIELECPNTGDYSAVDPELVDQPQPQRSTVPDLPCPKCGSADVSLHYRSDAHRRCFPGGEHFHRRCRRCGYDWVTTDVLAPEGSAGETTR